MHLCGALPLHSLYGAFGWCPSITLPLYSSFLQTAVPLRGALASHMRRTISLSVTLVRCTCAAALLCVAFVWSPCTVSSYSAPMRCPCAVSAVFYAISQSPPRFRSPRSQLLQLPSSSIFISILAAKVLSDVFVQIAPQTGIPVRGRVAKILTSAVHGQPFLICTEILYQFRRAWLLISRIGRTQDDY